MNAKVLIRKFQKPFRRKSSTIENKGEISTMRIIVLIVVLVFAVVYIKLGWVAGSFEEFFIDTSWIYILGLAFGSKAFQKFAENDDKTP